MLSKQTIQGIIDDISDAYFDDNFRNGESNVEIMLNLGKNLGEEFMQIILDAVSPIEEAEGYQVNTLKHPLLIGFMKDFKNR